MTKQEEIREGIAFESFWIDCGAGDRIDARVYWDADAKAREEWRHRADLLIAHLNSQGVVIKADRELPKLNETYKDFGGNDSIWEEAQQDMLKAGYVAVEPLIGLHNDNKRRG